MFDSCIQQNRTALVPKWNSGKSHNSDSSIEFSQKAANISIRVTYSDLQESLSDICGKSYFPPTESDQNLWKTGHEIGTRLHAVIQ